MRHAHLIAGIALVSAVVLSGCKSDEPVAQANGRGSSSSSSSSSSRVASLTIPSGTTIDVTLNNSISSKTANVGDSWTGSVQNSSAVDGRNAIPAGSVVSGTVTGAKPAKRGDRAMLDLGLSSITVGAHRYTVHGGTEAIIAGSTRARNLGAIAGSAAGGALIGGAVSGKGKGALIGGLIGAGVATGIVASSDGYQVVLKPGTALTFTTSEVVAVKY
jgi:hypothetical protein